MRSVVYLLVFFILTGIGCKENNTVTDIPASGNSLLWKISGKGLKQPSYIYGTVHLLCSEDAELSKNFKSIIGRADAVYLEMDLDDTDVMLSLLEDMKMRGDTTLEMLLSENELEKVKHYLKEHKSMLPYSVLKSFLPLLTSTTLTEEFMDCEQRTGVEEEIMELAKKDKKEILGMESAEYQMNLIDNIPYSEQAGELLAFIDSVNNGSMKKQMDIFYNAYREQDIDKIEKITFEMGSNILKYADVLLYQRNRNWVDSLKNILPNRSIVVAVGAGHLPGEKGIISLLRKEGYELTALENEIPPGKK